MRFVTAVLSKAMATFGAISVVITVAYAVISNSSLFTSDDSYVLGGAVALALLPGVVFYYIFQEYTSKTYLKHAAFFAWLFVILLYFSTGYWIAQEGRGMVLFLCKVSAIAAFLTYITLRIVDRRWVCIVLNCLAIIYLVSYAMVVSFYY